MTVEEIIDGYEKLCREKSEIIDGYKELCDDKDKYLDKYFKLCNKYKETCDRYEKLCDCYEALCDRKDESYDELAKAYDELLMAFKDISESENLDVLVEIDDESKTLKSPVNKKKIYAHGMLSREDLISTESGIQHVFDKDIVASYLECKDDFDSDKHYFAVKKDGLYSHNGKICYIRVDYNTYVVLDDFYRFLVSFGSDWTFAKSSFSLAMCKRLNS